MQMLDSACERLRDVLQDIAVHIQIESNFCISHPKYESLQPPSEVVSRLQQLPGERQNHYLNLQMRNFLYRVYYNGSLETTFASVGVEDNIVREQYLKFYERLHNSNSGQGYFDSDWRVLRQESNGNLAVRKNGLTLQIERVSHLQLVSAIVGDTVAIRMPRNLIEPGFYVAVGNAGLVERANNCQKSVQIYFNVSSEGAIALMRSITQQLNSICIPFTFKVLANLFEYGRYDSGILCIERDNYPQVRSVLQSTYAENKLHFQLQVPLFTKQLMPGLSLAEEPDYKFTVKEDFGKNRCQIVANGLIEVWQKGNESIHNRLVSICKQFSLLGISLQSPYLNPKSEDIYTF